MTDRAAARDLFRDVVAMAPMATGGNLPYRRLCREYRADLTCSEMVLAHKLVRGSRREMPLLRRHESEGPFGIQIAGSKPGILADGARLAVEHGADYVDLNFGCPIDVMVRKGIGAALLKRPGRLASLVAAVREAVDVPLLVKIRSGWSEAKINAVDVARQAAEAGADAISVHGRTREQRYRRDAVWEVIDAVARAVDVPVLGNGDLLTVWDLADRRATTAVAGFVVARGALIKPWIFREMREGVAWYPTVAERWGVMRRWFELATEHFGDDETGLERVERFFLWHVGFWHRYRPHTEADWAETRPGSLIQTRDAWAGDDAEERLLASDDEADHARLWRRLLDRDHPGA